MSVSVVEVRGRAGQRLGERVVLQQLAEAALAGVDPAGQLLEVLQRRLERVGGLRILQQLAERAAALLDARASARSAVATNCCSSV